MAAANIDVTFRAMPQRLLGYGVAVGEAVKDVTPDIMGDLCYIIGQVYALCHVIIVLAMTSDAGLTTKAALWEAITCTLMAFVVSLTNFLSFAILDRIGLPDILVEYVPTILSLAVIALLQEPLDSTATLYSESIFNSVMGLVKGTKI